MYRPFLVLMAVACSGDTLETDPLDSGDAGTDAVVQGWASLFDAALFVSEPGIVSCTLETGEATECYELSFANYQDSTGPFCPPTIDDIGGVGIYDGATNPGFQVLKRQLWESMEADGWDIVDEAGNVATNAGMGAASCLDMDVTDLTVTFLIPVEPQMLDTPNEIGVVELFGVALVDGMPLTGHPPSVTNGPPMPGAQGGGIPSLDPCGGHGDPAGYWHWHFTPDNTQSVLDAFGITDVSCTDVPQRVEGLVGFAKDGVPIYSPLSDGSVPSGLDACNGLFGPTPEFPDGIYHYYAVHETAPNLPTCIQGASVRDAFSVR